jgi:glyoxylase-like metal-dependent hydrolase (beta-lactamase superfamily II)
MNPFTLLLGAFGAALTANAATLQPIAQHQAITGLAAPRAANEAVGFRVITVASPAPDAINMHIVETPQGLVLFDALRRSTQVTQIVQAIERTGKQPLALFLTHAHTDHYGGVAFLKARYPALAVYASEEVARAMREDPNGDNRRRRAMFGAAYPTQQQIDANLPSRFVRNGKPIIIAGLRIDPLVMGPSESPAATVYRLPQLRAVMTGDLVNVLTVSAPVQSLDNWLRQLDRIEAVAKEGTMLHVGHGPSGPAASLIAEQRRYLVHLDRLVRTRLDPDRMISPSEREEIVAELRAAYPHYGGAAALPPDELIRASIGWVARQRGGRSAE